MSGMKSPSYDNPEEKTKIHLQRSKERKSCLRFLTPR